MNLLLCYYAIGDREKQKRHFQRMTQLTCSTDPEDNRYYLSDVSLCNSKHDIFRHIPRGDDCQIYFVLDFFSRRPITTSVCYWRL